MNWLALALLVLARPVSEDIPADGVAIDLTGWTYRKKITVEAVGVHQLDLDLEALAHAARDLRDVRIVRDGQQFPYLLESPVETRRYVPVVDSVPDPKRPTVSVWRIRLPAEGAPVSRLVCRTRAPLFDRQATLRGLGSARWVRTPGEASQPLELTLTTTPTSAEMFLEIENGDNPPIALEDFELEYPVKRLLFRAPMSPDTFLYYGHATATAPSYDLALIAPQLRAAVRAEAKLGTEERVRPVSLTERLERPGGRRFIFWAALGIVVAALLAVIARLLPKNPSGR